MANTPLPVARTKISIGGATGTYTQTALAADTYVLIGRVRSVPGFGDTFQDITVEEVADGRTRHGKGTANATSMDIVCSRQDTDPGQIAMNAAAASYLSFNLKMEIPNEDGTFDVVYFSVLVNSANVGLGGPNDTQTRTYSCQPQEAPIEVPAA
ncbi:hypothetical protein [Antarcticirhabdus aurantiaca]|uniref:Uncharacterized protein n=1 Tax=Antarcticirhabdus aurantiaca TaxID=2606717 RepID=A0ACD4NLN8_9HYPH|nr:hypothetical protein [Antarcticirhabdus aurantiaca]WAJ27541.1 hypothetical protein OXU80_22270 [Jeongeuplla avenae]